MKKKHEAALEVLASGGGGKGGRHERNWCPSESTHKHGRRDWVDVRKSVPPQLLKDIVDSGLSFSAKAALS